MTQLKQLELKKLELQLELLKLEAQRVGLKIASNSDHTAENCCTFNTKEPYFNKHLKAWMLPNSWTGARWAKWLGFESVEWPIDPYVVHQISTEEDEDETLEVETEQIKQIQEEFIDQLNPNQPSQNTES